MLANSSVGQVSLHEDAHYIPIVRQGQMIVEEYNFILNFNTDQTWRCFQHFRVRLQGDGNLVTVINCHAPSSGKRILTTERRLGYFREFHKVSGEDHSIWGGDFNTKPIQASAMLRMEVHKRYADEDATSSAEQPRMKVDDSHPLTARGSDIAPTYGLQYIHVNSKV